VEILHVDAEPRELTVTTQQKIKRHPVRGGLFGLMLGISAAYFLYFQFAVFGFDTVSAVATRFIVIILVGVVVGVIWAYIAPPRKAKGSAPPAPAAAPEAPPAEPPAPEAPAWSEASQAEETSESDEADGPEDAWRPVSTEDDAVDDGTSEEA